MRNDPKKDEQRNLNRDIHRNAVNERFPESSMSKDQRKDAEKLRKSTRIQDESAASEGDHGSVEDH